MRPYPRYGQMVKGYRYRDPITFDARYGHLASGQFPAECIEACSASGAVNEAVEYWRLKLGFKVPRELAIAYLHEFGAWPMETDKHEYLQYDTGLNQMSDEDIAEKVLWLACCDIREQGEWSGLYH